MPIPVQTVSTFARSGGYPGITGQDLPNSVAALNAQSGSTTLVAGTKTVTGVTLTANSVIQVTQNTPGGTVGQLSVPAASRVVGTGTGQFAINSASGTDTSVVDWLVIG